VAALPSTAAACKAMAEAEGISLIPSKNGAGYFGVRVTCNKRDDGVVAYAARESMSGGRVSYTGRYPLPEQAALVFARTYEGRAAAAKAAESDKADALALSAVEAECAAESEGLTLVRSESASGFKHVKMHSSTSFQVQVKAPGSKKSRHLGYFSNAPAAALCLARYHADERRWRGAPTVRVASAQI
jgi:hypothetical protein